MSKPVTEAPITSRAERRRLAIGVHWRAIDPDVHLGYRKRDRGGVWLVRWYLGDGKYRQLSVGTADDELAEGTLDFRMSVRVARDLVDTERRQVALAAEGFLLTVGNAVKSYIAMRDARESARNGREVGSDARSRLTRYLNGRPACGTRKPIPASPLADVPLNQLSELDLLQWRAGLPASLKRTSQQRLVGDLKAALNGAYLANRSRLPSTLPETIKHGLKADDPGDDVAIDVARENQILSDEKIALLIGAAAEIDAEDGWDGDLLQIVAALAATGARFSQAARLRVGDLQSDLQRLIVPKSRKGRGGKRGSTPIPLGRDVLDVLLPASRGRPNDAPLLERWRKRQVGGVLKWQRDSRGPWKSASELSRPWAAICDRAALPGVIPYALRHSSIVRGLRANLPIRLVAALHDTSVAMIERHYGRFIADGLEELAARSIVPLVPRANKGSGL